MKSRIFLLLLGHFWSSINCFSQAGLEPHRPRFHFTPPSMWMNDPNGLVYYEGEYHLFYQHYPNANVWGPMHWGHAVSTDLVHWQHLPIALYPDSLGYIFSGSAVVDWKNTSGFGRDGRPPLVAMFTYHDPVGEKAGSSDFQYQGIAYSNDKGRTWTKYPGNPVIPNREKIRDFRDPKLVWDEVSNQWVLVFAAYDHVKIWGSRDLKSWAHLSDFGKNQGAHGGVWECPDLFPIRLDKTGERKWVLLSSIGAGSPNGGSGTQYFVGDFDGKQFTLDPAFSASQAAGHGVWLDYGRDNYAGVTWSDIPASDGRRIFLGWMSNWDYAQVVPTEVWRSAMTIPRVLELKSTANGSRLFSNPVVESKGLRGKRIPVKPGDLAGLMRLGSKADKQVSGLEIELTFAIPEGQQPDFGIVLSNTSGQSYRIGFNARKNSYFSDRTKAGSNLFSPKFATSLHLAPRSSTIGVIKMHLIIDVSSAELFADDGAVALTELFFPDAPFNQIQLFSEGGMVQLLEGQVFPLNP